MPGITDPQSVLSINGQPVVITKSGQLRMIGSGGKQLSYMHSDNIQTRVFQCYVSITIIIIENSLFMIGVPKISRLIDNANHFDVTSSTYKME